MPEKNSLRKYILITVSAVLLIGAAIVLVNHFFRGRPSVEVVFHGEQTESMNRVGYIPTDRMVKGMENILINDNGFLYEYYSVEWQRGETILKYSESVYLEDQIRLLSYYIRTGNRRSYNNLKHEIRKNFLAENGLYNIKINYRSEEPDKSEIDIPVQLKFIRALLEGYYSFGNQADYHLANEIADKIFPLCAEYGMVPSKVKIALLPPTPTPDFSATPTPSPDYEEDFSPGDIEYLEVADLSSIDLYSIYLLKGIDTKWTDIYINTLEIMKNSIATGPVIYYRPAYDKESEEYIPYKTRNPLYKTSEQLQIAISISEVLDSDDRVYSFLKQKLHNTNALYKYYNIPSGNPATEDEDLKAYALMAKLARMKNDQHTYDLAVDMIFRNTATSPTSPVFGLTFTYVDDDKIKTYSSDVILALNFLN